MIIEELSDAPPPMELARAWRDRRGFFHLDSSRPEETSGRAFSYLGFEPFLTWQARGEQVTVETGGHRKTIRAEPLVHLRNLLARYHRYAAPGGGIPFGGGAVGYFGYEFGTRSAGVTATAPGEPELPDAQFGFYDGVIVCDLAAGKTYAVVHPVAGRSAGEILTTLREAVRSAARTVTPPAPHPRPAAPVPNLTKADYLLRVARIQEYLAAGDIYQVNLAQRFETATTEHPHQIYERLRTLSPAPYGAYLEAGGFQILSTSPELLLQLDGAGRAVTRPIKGTRPRGRTAAEDQHLAAELVASAKDQAELLMIVDLERNDLGRVCRPGSVQVEERHRLEAHPTVFHLVATIAGQLAEGRDLFDGLRALLPGGSISGAPKIRALQIIAELEPCRREIYTGAIGWLGWDGACALNIAIRTIVCRAGSAHYHVGSGIVADSDPESEYAETLAKGRALREALL